LPAVEAPQVAIIQEEAVVQVVIEQQQDFQLRPQLRLL
jgi:hypothetical protein